MGLLDPTDPQSAMLTNIALGLLSAGGPSARPISLGQAMGQAGQMGMEGYGQAQENQMRKIQMGLLNMQLARTQQQNALMSGILQRFGQGQPSQLANAPQSGGVAPPDVNTQGAALSPSVAPVGRQSFPLGFNDVVALKLLGGPDLSTDFKIANEGFERKPGSYYSDVNGNTTYSPDPTKGITLDKNGNVVTMPGAPQAISALAASQSFGTEAGKAPYNLTTITVGGKTYQAPGDIAAAVTAGSAPDDATARRAAQWLNMHGLRADIGVDGSGGSGTPGIGESQSPAQAEFDKGRAASTVKYSAQLNDTVGTLNDEMQRINAMRQAMQGFQPGASAPMRMAAAKYLKDAGLVDLANRVGRGEVGSAQEFTKLAAGQAMQDLRSAMEGGRITQSEFKIFQDANPNIGSDPDAIEKLFQVINDRRALKVKEQSAFENYLSKGGNPATWESQWTNQVDQGNLLQPSGKSSVMSPDGWSARVVK